MNKSNWQIEVKISDTDVFKNLLDVLRDFAEDEEIPEQKRKQFVDRIRQVGAG